MQRVHGGGNAVRAVACLPALIGAWRDPAGGALLSSSGTFPVDTAALERPDLIHGTPRTINMSTIGDALTRIDDPPIRAIYVYNSNPVAVAPESSSVAAGFARDDLFCVVHEIFQDRHRRLRGHPAAGDDAARADRHPQLVRPPVRAREQSGDRAARRGAAEHRGVPAARRAHGVHRPLLPGQRRRPCAAGLQRQRRAQRRHRLGRAEGTPACSGSTCRDRTRRSPKAAFRRRRASASSGPRRLAAQGEDPLPAYVSPRESAASNPELAARYPLGFLSPPARNFLNSSFANLPAFVEEEKTPHLDIHPDDAAARGIATGDSVRVFNDRGSLLVVGARDRSRAPRRGRGAVGVVAQARAGRRERERRDEPGADRSRSRARRSTIAWWKCAPRSANWGQSEFPATTHRRKFALTPNWPASRSCAPARPSRRRFRARLPGG